MNIINKALLHLVLLPSKFYEQLGIDTQHLKAILTAKLTVDDRKPNTLHQTTFRKKEKPINAATVGTVLISLFFGFCYLLAFSIGRDSITQMSFYFFLFFFMLAAALISDFTAVLIDTRDNYIILPTPVNDRTVLASRIMHIFIHWCKLLIPMSLPGLVMVIIKFGVAASLTFLCMVFMGSLFTLFLVNAVYILILKITTPQKFQTAISYVQVMVGILLYASYQIVPHVLENLEKVVFNAQANPALLLLPPYWFACGWRLFYFFQGNTFEWIAAIASVTLPLLALFFVVKCLAPSFNNRLALLNASEAKGKPTKKYTNSNFVDSVSRWFTKAGAERMGFLFSWKLSGRSRDFRLKVYPSIGYLIVYVAIILYQSKNLSLEEIKTETNTGKGMLILGLYICSYLPIMALSQSAFSEKFKASWMYFVTPVEKPGAIISGNIKAILAKFALPLAFVVVIGGLTIIGLSAMPNILLGLINQVLMVYIVAYISPRHLPFTLHQGNQSKTGNFFRGLTTVLISGFLALLHFIIYDYLPVVIIFVFLSATATWLLMGSIKHTSWEKIETEEQ